MLAPQVASILVWGYLAFSGTPANAQRFRNAANAPVAGRPLDIIWDSTTLATASIIGSVTASVNSTSFSSIPSTTVASVTTSPVSISTNIRTPSTSATITSTVSQATTSHITTPRSVSSLSRNTTARGSPTSIHKRAANPECLKTVELSCLNLAANCLSAVNFGNRNSLWGIKSCVAAATCYGVGDLLTSVNCQTGFDLTNSVEGNLDNNIFLGIVKSCVTNPGACSMTRQNYIDFYYGMLDQVNSANRPSSANVVIAFWNPILSWAATGTAIPYKNFNDWLHFSSFPSPPLTITQLPVPTFTTVTWNPNPVPSSGASSQTFIRSSTTVIIAIPTTTTTVTVAGATITVAPGGTPVGGTVPPDVTQPGAVVPTWNPNPIIPSTASSVTFVAGTWTSVVPVPTSSNSPITVHGPPDDDDDDDNNLWLIIFGLLGPIIIGALPASVSVIGAPIPAPTPPTNWPDNGTWIPPPAPSGGDPDDPDDPEEPQTCHFSTLPPYTFPYDGGGDFDPEDGGFRRRELDFGQYGNNSRSRSEQSLHMLYKRAVRRIVLGRCGDARSFNGVGLNAATWYSINPPNVIPAVSSSATTLFSVPGSTHASHDGKEAEHLFEFRFILDFFNAQFTAADCAWLRQNVWNAAQPDGTLTNVALGAAIDQVANLVWADAVINTAKSYVTNNDKPNANDPPLSSHIAGLNSLDPAVSGNNALQIEELIRSFGVLGQYLDVNSAAIRATAQRVQDILSLITPATPSYPPVDTRFNNYFTGIMSVYTQRIRQVHTLVTAGSGTYPTFSTRGVNTYNAYIARLNVLLAQAIATNPPGNPAPVVPACWPVYHDPTVPARLNNAGINAPNFIPPALQHPSCNTAGQSGRLVLWTDSNGNQHFFAGNPVFQIAALGSRYSGLWLPTATTIYYDVDLAAFYGGQCTGIHYITRGPTGQTSPNFRIATWDQACNGVNNGPALSTLHIVNANNNRQVCFFNNFNDGSNTFAIDCGPSQAAVQTCITHMNQVDGVPNAATSVPFLQFRAS